MTHYLPFILFAFVASITPGPTNILVLSNSALHGLGVALRIALGASAGAALIVLLTGLGLGEFLQRLPWLQQLMGWLGVAWISLLAWQLWRAPASVLTADSQSKAMGAWAGAGLQLINPKTWLMALAVVSVFTGAQASAGDYGLYAAIFFMIATPCLLVWALLGRGAASLLTTAQAMQRFNRGMALLLLGSAWGGLFV
ncbi:LysE family translocator [Pseudomonas sp. 21LCFQ010]|uniref:LysE family translocator n=1 Tax=Pseudomonas sp. 21LCFQ010 TaxID=2957506 RepID=UPI0020975681|nr:LysE family translocator [Pseudomonas sp. 21LCFQ010]MCO8164006.1 LysE family translocator [Pseudomonas sp. 21LCFQ010]